MLVIALASLVVEAEHAAPIRDIGQAVLEALFAVRKWLRQLPNHISTNARRLNVSRSRISSSASMLLMIATPKLCCQLKQRSVRNPHYDIRLEGARRMLGPYWPVSGGVSGPSRNSTSSSLRPLVARHLSAWRKSLVFNGKLVTSDFCREQPCTPSHSALP